MKEQHLPEAILVMAGGCGLAVAMAEGRAGCGGRLVCVLGRAELNTPAGPALTNRGRKSIRQGNCLLESYLQICCSLRKRNKFTQRKAMIYSNLLCFGCFYKIKKIKRERERKGGGGGGGGGRIYSRQCS